MEVSGHFHNPAALPQRTPGSHMMG